MYVSHFFTSIINKKKKDQSYPPPSALAGVRAVFLILRSKSCSNCLISIACFVVGRTEADGHVYTCTLIVLVSQRPSDVRLGAVLPVLLQGRKCPPCAMPERKCQCRMLSNSLSSGTLRRMLPNSIARIPFAVSAHHPLSAPTTTPARPPCWAGSPCAQPGTNTHA